MISVYPDESYALARVITSGSIQSNRAIDVIDQPIKLKSLTELDDLIESKGLSFGMDVSRYKLDRD